VKELQTKMTEEYADRRENVSKNSEIAISRCRDKKLDHTAVS
jgi:hypothetical protein